MGKMVYSSGKTETGKWAEVVTEVNAMSSKPKSKNNPNPKINQAHKPTQSKKRE